MKKFEILGMGILILGILTSCDDVKAPRPEVVDGYIVGNVVEAEITSSHETCRGDEVVNIFQLSNGMEVFVYKYSVYLHDHGEELNWTHTLTDAARAHRDVLNERWHRARTGLNVKIYLSRSGKVIEILTLNPDYRKERTVTKVTKYDGNLAKIDGHMTGQFLGGSSGSLHGESMGSQGFYVNVYFDEGKPLFVNAKENQQWLDVEVGDKVIESSVNGLINYEIVPQ